MRTTSKRVGFRGYASECIIRPIRMVALALGALLVGGLDAHASDTKSSPAPSSVGTFSVRKHGQMPKPRQEGTESHHGLMSAWLKARYSNYNPEEAPAVQMPKSLHDQTRAVYNKWRPAVTAAHGGLFDWGKVSEKEIRALGEQMFETSGVPVPVRRAYWAAFEEYQRVLSAKTKKGSR